MQQGLKVVNLTQPGAIKKLTRKLPRWSISFFCDIETRRKRLKLDSKFLNMIHSKTEKFDRVTFKHISLAAEVVDIVRCTITYTQFFFSETQLSCWWWEFDYEVCLEVYQALKIPLKRRKNVRLVVLQL